MSRNTVSCLTIALSFALLAGCADRGATRSDATADNAGGAPAADRCVAATHTLAAVQGSGMQSPLVGQTVTAYGVVTAALTGEQGQDLGLYMQDESAGVFVRSAGARNFTRGRRVLVEGTVAEAGDGDRTMTEIVASTVFECGAGELAAQLLTLPLASWEAWEAVEGREVRFAGPLHLVGVYGLMFDGTVDVAREPRLWTSTQVAAPGAEASNIARSQSLAMFTYEDLTLARVSGPLTHFARTPTGAEPLRSGDQVGDIVGVVDQFQGRYRVRGTAAATTMTKNPRPAAVPAVAGRLRIAAFNVENYFNGDGLGGGFPTTRGAPDSASFARQRAKTAEVLNAVGAHVIGLNEIENDGFGPNSALSTLTTDLNAKAAGSGRDYRFVQAPTAQIGSDEIAVGLLYDQRAVKPVGAAGVVEGGPFATGSRVPLYQRFAEVSSGAQFTVAVVHMKSKRCDPAAEAADQDQRDGQGCFAAARRVAVETLMQAIKRAGIDGELIVLGDFNAYARESALQPLRDMGFVSALERYDPQGYGYVYQGRSGSLDHAFVSAKLAGQMVGAASWAINADEVPEFGYKSATQMAPGPYRSSDHDPLIVGLNLAR